MLRRGVDATLPPPRPAPVRAFELSSRGPAAADEAGDSLLGGTGDDDSDEGPDFEEFEAAHARSANGQNPFMRIKDR